MKIAKLKQEAFEQVVIPDMTEEALERSIEYGVFKGWWNRVMINGEPGIELTALGFQVARDEQEIKNN